MNIQFVTYLIQFRKGLWLPSRLDLSWAVQTSSQLPPSSGRTSSSSVGQSASNSLAADRISAVILLGVDTLLAIDDSRSINVSFFSWLSLRIFCLWLETKLPLPLSFDDDDDDDDDKDNATTESMDEYWGWTWILGVEKARHWCVEASIVSKRMHTIWSAPVRVVIAASNLTIFCLFVCSGLADDEDWRCCNNWYSRKILFFFWRWHTQHDTTFNTRIYRRSKLASCCPTNIQSDASTTQEILNLECWILSTTSSKVL